MVYREENLSLLSPVMIAEVSSILWSLGEDKAPGLNGFPPVFFKRFWSIIAYDVQAV